MLLATMLERWRSGSGSVNTVSELSTIGSELIRIVLIDTEPSTYSMRCGFVSFKEVFHECSRNVEHLHDASQPADDLCFRSSRCARCNRTEST